MFDLAQDPTAEQRVLKSPSAGRLGALQKDSLSDPLHTEPLSLKGYTDTTDTTPEYPKNVKTLVNLVKDLPKDINQQSGAQVIRATMEAIGVSMEKVLSETQAAQTDLLDTARANLRQIETYKTAIEKLEHDIRFQQNKANELSGIIDLFLRS